MAVIVDIAESIKDSLQTADFSREFEVERAYRPALERDFEGILVTVVPSNISRVPRESTRGGDQWQYDIDIGVQKRFDQLENVDLDPLTDLAEEIMDYVNGLSLDSSDASLVDIQNDPVFAPDHISQQVFTSIVTATYAVRR